MANSERLELGDNILRTL